MSAETVVFQLQSGALPTELSEAILADLNRVYQFSRSTVGPCKGLGKCGCDGCSRASPLIVK